MRDVPSNQKHFRGEYFFVYYGREWEIPLVPTILQDPNLALNFDIPQMSDEEAVVALYFVARDVLRDGKKEWVPTNWIPSPKSLSSEKFLSATGLSPAFPKGRKPRDLCTLFMLC